MSFLRTVIITILSISTFVFVALFGRLPAFRKTPIGFLNRLILFHIPHGFIWVDERLTGRRITRNTTRFFDYLMNEPHPVVMVFFLLLQVVGEGFFIPAAIPFLTSSSWAYLHLVAVPLAVIAPYIALYHTHTHAWTPRNTVTPANHHATVAAYPYDYILYHPHQTCRTCQMAKPARSKHCSICGVCVQRQDHHCVWINGCVGRGNYVAFLLLLASISILLLYASLLGYGILKQISDVKFGRANWATGLGWYEYLDSWGWVIATEPRIGAVTLLTMMCLPLSSAFLLYHVFLLWAGMTTNEQNKWSELKEDISDNIVWKARVDDMAEEYPAASDGRSNPGLRSWPLTASWWVVRMQSGMGPVRHMKLDSGVEEEVADDRWIKVKNLQRDIENVYDLGFWRNIQDILWNH